MCIKCMCSDAESTFSNNSDNYFNSATQTNKSWRLDKRFYASLHRILFRSTILIFGKTRSLKIIWLCFEVSICKICALDFRFSSISHLMGLQIVETSIFLSEKQDTREAGRQQKFFLKLIINWMSSHGQGRAQWKVNLQAGRHHGGEKE